MGDILLGWKCKGCETVVADAKSMIEHTNRTGHASYELGGRTLDRFE